MTDASAWVEPAVNAERRRLREAPRLDQLSSRLNPRLPRSALILVENAAGPAYSGFPGIRRCVRLLCTAPARVENALACRLSSASPRTLAPRWTAEIGGMGRGPETPGSRRLRCCAEDQQQASMGAGAVVRGGWLLGVLSRARRHVGSAGPRRRATSYEWASPASAGQLPGPPLKGRPQRHRAARRRRFGRAIARPSIEGAGARDETVRG